MYVDFKALKAAVPMVDVLQWLGLKLKPEGKQWRGSCPFCESDNERAFVCTPADHVYYCHSCAYGKDTIDLVARMKGCSTREAAVEMAKHFGTDGKGERLNSSTVHSSPSTTKVAAPQQELKPLENLSVEHAAIDALGLTTDTATALGIGYCAKGLMRGRVVFPLRTAEGRLCGYAGLATSADQAPLMLLPKNLGERLAAPTSKQEPQQDDVRSFLRVVK